MTADEIFEKLGYVKHASKFRERFDLCSVDDESLIIIVFNSKTRRISIHCDGEALDLDELRAINKKVEELGW